MKNKFEGFCGRLLFGIEDEILITDNFELKIAFSNNKKNLTYHILYYPRCSGRPCFLSSFFHVYK